jgi:hypothetical protein
MKTSELIKKLQEAIVQYGDIDACFRDTTKGARHIKNVSRVPVYDRKTLLETYSVLMFDI